MNRTRRAINTIIETAFIGFLAIMIITAACGQNQTNTSPPLPDPEIIDHVTGVKIVDAGLSVTLLVLLQPPGYADQARTTISITNMRNYECLYVADVPADQPAQVLMYGGNGCLRDGHCSGSKVVVKLHSFDELH